jgi:hypothetical protein
MSTQGLQPPRSGVHFHRAHAVLHGLICSMGSMSSVGSRYSGKMAPGQRGAPPFPHGVGSWSSLIVRFMTATCSFLVLLNSVIAPIRSVKLIVLKSFSCWRCVGGLVLIPSRVLGYRVGDYAPSVKRCSVSFSSSRAMAAISASRPPDSGKHFA